MSTSTVPLSNADLTATYYGIFLDSSVAPPKPFNAYSGATETYNSSNWTSTKYCVGTSSLYNSNGAGVPIPSNLPDGTYSLFIYQSTGGSPGVTDPLVSDASVTVASGIVTAVGED